MTVRCPRCQAEITYPDHLNVLRIQCSHCDNCFELGDMHTVRRMRQSAGEPTGSEKQTEVTDGQTDLGDSETDRRPFSQDKAHETTRSSSQEGKTMTLLRQDHSASPVQVAGARPPARSESGARRLLPPLRRASLSFPLLVALAIGVVLALVPRTPFFKKQIPGHRKGPVLYLHLLYTPERQRLISLSADGSMRTWNLQKDEPQTDVDLKEKFLSSAALSPDGLILARGDEQGKLYLEKSQTGELLPNGSWDAHAHPIRHVFFLPTGLFLATVDDHLVIRIWNLWMRTRVLEVDVLKERKHRTDVTCFALAMDDRLPIPIPVAGKVAIGRRDGRLELWELMKAAQGQQHETFELGSRVTAAAFSSSGLAVAAGTASGEVHLKLLEGLGEPQPPYVGHKGPVTVVRFSPDSKLLASGGVDGTIRIWNFYGSTEWLIFKGPRSPVTALAFSLDGSVLASGHKNGELYLWMLLP